MNDLGQWTLLDYLQKHDKAQSLLKPHNTPPNYIPEEYLWLFLTQVLMGLLGIHDANYMHRDISLKNLVMSEKGLLVRICDCGSARQIDSGNFTRNIGSKGNQAPEMLGDQGNSSYTQKIDVCSLGSCIYELMTLQPNSLELTSQPQTLTFTNHTLLTKTKDNKEYFEYPYSEELIFVVGLMLEEEPFRPSVKQLLSLRHINEWALHVLDTLIMTDLFKNDKNIAPLRDRIAKFQERPYHPHDPSGSLDMDDPTQTIYSPTVKIIYPNTPGGQIQMFWLSKRYLGAPDRDHTHDTILLLKLQNDTENPYLEGVKEYIDGIRATYTFEVSEGRKMFMVIFTNSGIRAAFILFFKNPKDQHTPSTSDPNWCSSNLAFLFPCPDTLSLPMLSTTWKTNRITFTTPVSPSPGRPHSCFLKFEDPTHLSTERENPHSYALDNSGICSNLYFVPAYLDPYFDSIQTGASEWAMSRQSVPQVTRHLHSIPSVDRTDPTDLSTIVNEFDLESRQRG
ncbi:putative Protein kinase domain containing protein [Blattamonas nauphoetae]|uniref:non-specific serine/threonine protein kinase n=1 Tax=Blattamonas nauphoetae TaxID=2049346 RepID=A0ABQ9XBQ6_9EUKA|nr:putative Protein kinase domain containing protein [Blattamonas nauphoetae]